MSDIPPPSWKVFDECPTCGTSKKMPCYNLRVSTSKNLVQTNMPHPKRKKLPVKDPWHPEIPV